MRKEVQLFKFRRENIFEAKYAGERKRRENFLNDERTKKKTEILVKKKVI